MSYLVEFAERELRAAGMYDKDADYGPGAIAECILEMIKTFGSYGHSEGSRELAIKIFNRLVRFKPLSELTSNPQEWMVIDNEFHQSRRNPTCFSIDGGKTYYDLDGPGGKQTVYTAAESKS